ncbi:MAG: ORF6N domain-containing protein [Candidatus Moraniibacteriota bacterium]
MNEKSLIPSERIISRIFYLRDRRVILDSDIAKLYGVKTKALNQAVKRNIERFPEDFMFILTGKEMKILRSQFVTSRWGGRRYQAYAFTEQGVAMLSSILRSKTAIAVNVQIIRSFVWLRNFMRSNDEIKRKIWLLEKKYDQQFRIVFKAIRHLIQEEEKPKKIIGFCERK